MNTYGSPSSRDWNIAIWVVQGLLAAFFLMSGFVKTFLPLDQVERAVAWAADVHVYLLRFIGVAELAAGLGLVVPSLTRIQPRLTPYAALGIMVLLAFAAIFHLRRAEVGALPIVLTLGGMAAFVLWGRRSKVPVAPRARPAPEPPA